jgi:Flp pilus assembly protein TadD
MPQVAVQGSTRIMGRQDTGHPYVLGYRRHFIVGSVWGYTATRALACQVDAPDEAPWLWTEAFASLDACIRRGFHEADARLLRARLSLQRGDTEAALADLSARSVAVLSGGADQAEMAFLEGVARLNEGDLSGAIAPLETAVALAPDHVRSWQALAIARSYLGQDDAALAAFDAAAALAPDDGVNAFNRGLLNLQHGRREAAEADLLRAAQLLPDNTRALRLLQALATGREITVDSAQQPVVIVASRQEIDLARSLDHLIAGEAMEPEFDQLLAGDPEERSLWLELFEQRFADEPSEANRTRLAQAHHHVDDQSGVVAVLAGFCHELSETEAILILEADRELGHVARAAEVARLAASGGRADAPPWTLPVLVRAATILLDHGRPQEAAQVAAAARELAPDDPALRDLMARLPMH